MGSTSSIDEVPSVRFDPVDSLMVPMAENAEAGREFFDPGSDPDRVGYMLDREFDTHGGETVLDGNRQARVLDALAAASDGEEVDDAGPGFKIAASTIDHVGSNEADAVGLGNDAARESMGQLLEGQLDEVNEAITGESTGLLATELDETEALHRALSDVGRSPEAYASLSNAQAAYTAVEMQDPDRLGSAGARRAHVMGHLDHGRAAAIDEGWMESQEEFNGRVEAVGQVGAGALAVSTGRVPGGEAMTTAMVDNLVVEVKDDDSDHAARDVANLYTDTEEALGRMAEEALWQHQAFIEDPPPPELFDGEGIPIPLDEMSERGVRDAFREWSDGASGQSGMWEELRKVSEAYDAAHRAAKSSHGET